MIFGGAYKGPCPKDCPRRKAGCHDEATCENWARHVARQKARREENAKRYAAQRMSWEERTAKEKNEEDRRRGRKTG